MRRPVLLARLAVVAALTIVGQVVGLPQPFTGPFVNAMLVLTLVFVGWVPALVLGCVTPVVALVRGLLPPALGVALPIVAVGNAVFVSVYGLGCGLARQPLCYLGAVKIVTIVLTAALVKFSWFFLWVRGLLPLVMGARLPHVAAVVFTTPQFFSALEGGLGAVLLCVALVKTGVVEPVTPGRDIIAER
ncbi:MAG: hypothetical protein ONB07_07880 [candidate division KSB1 bacterium]|nr:hypothetical protein [candidate division KSB1 bacterium]